MVLLIVFTFCFLRGFIATGLMEFLLRKCSSALALKYIQKEYKNTLLRESFDIKFRICCFRFCIFDIKDFNDRNISQTYCYMYFSGI